MVADMVIGHSDSKISGEILNEGCTIADSNDQFDSDENCLEVTLDDISSTTKQYSFLHLTTAPSCDDDNYESVSMHKDNDEDNHNET